jgi:RimJ/RimL family protein N-acetyltransferase
MDPFIISTQGKLLLTEDLSTDNVKNLLNDPGIWRWWFGCQIKQLNLATRVLEGSFHYVLDDRALIQLRVIGGNKSSKLGHLHPNWELQLLIAPNPHGHQLGLAIINALKAWVFRSSIYSLTTYLKTHDVSALLVYLRSGWSVTPIQDKNTAIENQDLLLTWHNPEIVLDGQW